MSEREQSLTELAEALASNCHLAEELMLLLEEERAALIAEDSDAIFDISAQKSELLSKVISDYQSNQTLLENLFPEEAPSKVVDWATRLAPSDDTPGKENELRNHIRRDWLELASILRECKSTNVDNGHIIRVKKNNVDRLINKLTGETASTGYDASGQQVQGQSRQHNRGEA